MENEKKRFSSEIKVIDELFPKGKVSILASGPGVGKTIFACKIAKWLTYHRERVLYVNMASDHINVDTSDDDTLAWKCCIFDMPLLSIEDISFVLSRRYTFDTIILDYVELIYFVKGIECFKRKEELIAIWHFLDHIAKEKNIRVIGLSQLERVRIDGTEESCFDKVLKYLNRDFVRERLVVFHRPSYYEPQDNNIEQVQLITFKNGIKTETIFEKTNWKRSNIRLLQQ